MISREILERVSRPGVALTLSLKSGKKKTGSLLLLSVYGFAAAHIVLI